MSGRGGWGALYRVLLRLLPARLRSRSGEELAGVFDALMDEAGRRGRWAVHGRAARECADVLRLAAASRGPIVGDVLQGAARGLRVAARSLLRRPGFALAAAGTLALGLGATTAVFAVADALLLRPLPYPDGERLVMVWRVVERFDMRRAPISLPTFVDWRDGTDAFEGMAAYGGARPTLLGVGDPVSLRAVRVAGDLFGTLGVGVALGRPLSPSDDHPGAEPVVVLSHGLWTTRFGADPAAVGRVVDLGGRAARVVGVASPDLRFGDGTDVWMPLAMDPATAERDSNFLVVLARLRPGVSIAAAEAELRAAQARSEAAHPGGNEVDGIWLEPRKTYEVGDGGAAVLLIAGAVALLLLIACANLAALLLVRATGRRSELAVRRALGAGAGRIAGVLVAEGAVLAGVGAALGVGVAAALLRGLAVAAPPGLLARGAPAVDARVLAFGVTAAAACALGCALLPARAAARRGPAEGLRTAGRGGGRGRVHDGLVVAQVGLATVLLVAAGLLGRSLARLLDQPVGFDAEPVLAAPLSLSPDRYGSPEDAEAFFDRLLAALEGRPGVAAVGAAWALPFTNRYAGTSYLPEGAPVGAEPVSVSLVPVRGDYFGAVGMRVLEGRGFRPADAADAPAVGVVSRSFARALWPDGEAVGRRLVKSGGEGLTVVGVVGDIRRRGLDAEPERDLYVPHAQASWAARDLAVVLRAREGTDPAALAPHVREAVRELDPDLPLAELTTLSRRVYVSAAEPRSRALLLGGFAAAAALLASIGVYGVLAYRVAERRAEMALRVAFGASGRDVARRVLLRAAALGGVGVALGLASAAAATPVVEAFLFQVSPLEPVIYLGVTALIAASVAAAGWLPARRAARVDPMETLRSE